ncbi:phosphoribosyltransferase [Stutzerimonas tarimensis]|uniref:Phosphoribosyltransferase n=1 Tax=Stutzerimonas tarimensis TaxID=1507735 RepID=A0ABV7T5B1_9GAMM
MPPIAHPYLFEDRCHAGRELAEALKHLAVEEPLVLALPRGGVPVAYEIAAALEARLDIALVRKIGAPHNEEMALGAVIDGADPQWVVNSELVRQLSLPSGWFEEEKARQLLELERRRKCYCGDREPPRVVGRCVILVDDGVATGASMRAVLKGLHKAGAARLVTAVPVGARDAIAALRDEVDEMVCLAMPEPFIGVGCHYRDFSQTPDDEVVRLLERAAASGSRQSSRHAG